MLCCLRIQNPGFERTASPGLPTEDSSQLVRLLLLGIGTEHVHVQVQVHACLLDGFAVCIVGIKLVIFLATLAYMTRQHCAVSSSVYWLRASHIAAAHAKLTSLYKLGSNPCKHVYDRAHPHSIFSPQTKKT